MLATGEPCGLCYRFALRHRIGGIHVAVDADTVAAFGIDYRAGYSRFGIDLARLRGRVHQCPAAQGLEPFQRFLQINAGAASGYAIWVGIAGAGVAVLGALLFGQRITWAKAAGVALVIGGVIGLQLTGGMH